VLSQSGLAKGQIALFWPTKIYPVITAEDLQAEGAWQNSNDLTAFVPTIPLRLTAKGSARLSRIQQKQ